MTSWVEHENNFISSAPCLDEQVEPAVSNHIFSRYIHTILYKFTINHSNIAEYSNGNFGMFLKNENRYAITSVWKNDILAVSTSELQIISQILTHNQQSSVESLRIK